MTPLTSSSPRFPPRSWSTPDLEHLVEPRSVSPVVVGVGVAVGVGDGDVDGDVVGDVDGGGYMTFSKLTLASGNKKTGPIPVSTSDQSTCPSTCPFIAGNGCYGEMGPVFLWWKKLTRAASDLWTTFLRDVAALPTGTLWRHNQVGDLPHHQGWVRKDALVQLVEANRGKRGFTYTHHRVLGSSKLAKHNLELVAAANQGGFTINVSTETRAAADHLVDLGLPVALAVARGTKRITWTGKGRPVLVCPADYSRVTCMQCGWCARAKRNFIIAFPAHGTRAAKAEASIRRMQRRGAVRSQGQ